MGNRRGSGSKKPLRSQLPKKSSGTYSKTDPWSAEDELAFRLEVESRYIKRTPPQFPKHIEEMKRVRHDEMEEWSFEELGKPLPDQDEWAIEFILWYREMVARHYVHIRWLDRTLCQTDEVRPIQSDIESEVTCPECKKVFLNGMEPN